MKKALSGVLFLLFIWLLPLNAQQIGYTSPGRLNVGFGLGSSWQSSDIKNSMGTGLDLWIGTPLFQRENSFFALDWRFHFLAGSNKAYDHRVNADGSYSNVQLRHFNYDLELLLTLNRLRERTGMILGVFLGAGLTHGIVSADLLDASGNPYDYISIQPDRDRSTILADLKDLSDSDFETRLHGKAALFPTAGIFLGYQFSPHFALGLQHKMNFSLNEHNSFAGIDLDNRIVDGSAPDWNNYTGLMFRFTLGGKSTKKALKEDPAPATGLAVYPPQVDIAIPIDNPYLTADSIMKVSARVFNITRRSEITVLLNGRNQDFQFYNYINSVEITTLLQRGSNSLEISCRNEAGSDSDQVEIIFSSREESGPFTNDPDVINIATPIPGKAFLPDVRILTPVDLLSNYNTQAAEIVAEITRIDTPADISLSINGIRTSAFSYDQETGVLMAIVLLDEGTNHLSIKARNSFGSDRDNRTLVRETAGFIPPTPYTMIAPDRQNVYLEEPGQQTGTNPGQTVRVETNPNVNTGAVPIVIVDPKNSPSRDSGRPGVSRPGQPGQPVPADPTNPVTGNPTVTPTPGPCRTPVISMNISAATPGSTSYKLGARIQEVDVRENVSLLVNGSTVNSFNFNPGSESFSANLSLRPGTNSIVIAARNECGEERVSEIVDVQPAAGNDPGRSDDDVGWVRINPGNADWEFCLQTGSGTYNRSDLSNSGFSYSGAASSLFFKPIAGGGTAMVNGTYSLNPGQYYLFTGNLKVKVTNRHQGAMGQWSVYIESSSPPSTGKGNNRPQSPCGSGNKNPRK